MALDFDTLGDSEYNEFAKFVRELTQQFSSGSLAIAIGVDAEAQHE